MKEMLEDLISVIIPIYKVEKYLEKCLDSIIFQTYRNLEIILINDGSPDNCGYICDEYKKKDNRIIVIHKENGGLSSARNAGLERATGGFITFVDGDDYLALDMIEMLYQQLIKTQVDLCISPCQKVDETGTYFNDEKFNFTGILDKENALKKLAYGWSGFPMVACGKLGKAKVYKGLFFKEGKIHEDEFMFHDLLDRCDKILVLEEAYYFYVQHTESIVHTQFSIKRFDGVEAKIERTNFYINKGMHNEACCILHSAATYFCSCSERLKSPNKKEKQRILMLKLSIKNTFKRLRCSFKSLKYQCLLKLFIYHYNIYIYLYKTMRLKR